MFPTVAPGDEGTGAGDQRHANKRQRIRYSFPEHIAPEGGKDQVRIVERRQPARLGALVSLSQTDIRYRIEG